MNRKIRLAASLAVLALCLLSAISAGWAQTLPSTASISPAEATAPRMQVALHYIAGHGDHADARYDTWFMEGAVPQKITAELWQIENGRVTHLRTLTVANRFAPWAGDGKVPFNERYKGDISLLRHGITKTGTQGVMMPLPDMSIPLSRWQGGESTKGYYFRDNDPPLLTLPSDIADTVAVKETEGENGFLPNQPFALWMGQAPKKDATGKSIPQSITQSLLQAANQAAKGKSSSADALVALFDVLNNNVGGGNALLVMTVSWEALRSKVLPPPAPSVSADYLTSRYIKPFFGVNQYEDTPLNQNFSNVLHTWYMHGLGTGKVEAQIWYIKNGEANLRDQQILLWYGNQQEGTWRLQMREQADKDFLALPSYGLNTVFDNPKDVPDAKETGSANAVSHTPIRPPSGFNTFTGAHNTYLPRLIPNRPVIIYAAQFLKMPDQKSTDDLLRSDGLDPVEDLTKRSKAEPSKAFIVLTVQWKPARK